MRNIWLTSDTHYDHANVIRFCRRPWFRDGDEVPDENGRMVWASDEIAMARLKEMNEALLDIHNDMVRPGDEVWHLGDFCFGRHGGGRERTEYFVKRLNGQYHWVFGNHDHKESRNADGFASKQHYKELRKIGPDKQDMLVLSHYAMRVWNRRHYGAIQLYGHSHGTLPEDPAALACDVGVDCWDMKPVHLDAILGYMHEKRHRLNSAGVNWQGEDHHQTT